MFGLKNHYVILTIIIIISIVLSPCHTYSCNDIDSAPIGYVADSYNDFGFRVFLEVLKIYHEQNVFISPLSLAIGTAIVYNGADGLTKRDISKTLGISELSKEEVNEATSLLLLEYQSEQSGFQFNVANSIWMSEKWEFKQNYIKNIKLYYHADAFVGLDINKINNWIRDKTRGRIKGINIDLDQLSAAVIVNTIYYKSTWANKFFAPLTSEDKFFLCHGDVKNIEMMKQGGQYLYYENESYQAVELPFSDNLFSMFIVLPRDDICLNSIKFNSYLMDEFDEKCKSRQGKIHLPKFKINFESKYNDILSDLGMEIAFNMERANFKNMAFFKPSNNFYIEDVIQNTYLAVNEEGVEAAAATEFHIRAGGAALPREFTMIINKPFYMAIRDIRNDLIIFIGAIFDPQKIE